MSHRSFALLAAIACSACVLFQHWVYVAETRVTAESPRFSEAEIERAERVAQDVAKRAGMTPDKDPTMQRIGQTLSSNMTPPRRYLSSYSGRASGSRISLRLEIGLDDRELYFSIADRDRGTASTGVTRLRKMMTEAVDAAFPEAAIVHEAHSLGPFLF